MIPIAAVSLSVYALDLLTKIIIRKNLPLDAHIAVTPFFAIAHVQNTGIAFGLFQGKNFLLLLAGLVVGVGIFISALRLLPHDRVGALLMAAILGGALGNLTDRFFFGHVTDFLDFYWKADHWPTFNIADSCISVGATLLILREIFRKKNVSHPS